VKPHLESQPQQPMYQLSLTSASFQGRVTERPSTQPLYRDEFYQSKCSQPAPECHETQVYSLCSFSGDVSLHASALSIQNVIKHCLSFEFVVVVVLHNIRSLHTSTRGWKGTCELRCAISQRYSEIYNQHLKNRVYINTGTQHQ